MATSSSHATWSTEVSPDEDNSRVKNSIPGELYCYKNDSKYLNTSESILTRR